VAAVALFVALVLLAELGVVRFGVALVGVVEPGLEYRSEPLCDVALVPMRSLLL
jgi:hypothetical protein